MLIEKLKNFVENENKDSFSKIQENILLKMVMKIFFFNR